MTKDLPVLWHFRLSHFSEKVRWALDYKGIEHTKVDWPPGLQIGPTMLRTGQRLLPIMRLDGQWIHDSTAIIAHLEERQFLPHLYPRDSELEREALDWEDELDTDLGPATRTLIIDASLLIIHFCSKPADRWGPARALLAQGDIAGSASRTRIPLLRPHLSSRAKCPKGMQPIDLHAGRDPDQLRVA